jgi:hypothetical protein
MSGNRTVGDREIRTGYHAYLFAAKGIQRYILDSGPLRDLVGASDLVAELAGNPATTTDLIGRVLGALELKEEVAFSRRGGSAFCLHAERRETLDRVRALWRLTIGLSCPGLECSHSGPVSDENNLAALESAYRLGSAVRDNTAAELLPTGHPFTEFNRRTGRVMTSLHAYQEEPLPADLLTEPQRYRAQVLRGSGGLDGVARRFLVEGHHADTKPFVFPRNLEKDEEDEAANPAFPFLRGDRRIGVIHADLSGLGEIFQNVAARAEDIGTVLNVGAEIEAVVEGAAKVATRTVLEPHAKAWPGAALGEVAQHVLPARPVVLGGDDITVLVRADLAVRFTLCLLLEIERQSADACTRLMARHPKLALPERLSACAGIAMVNASTPFLMAQALADDLCRFAKKTAKAGTHTPYPSYLAFHNAQSTLQEDYDTTYERELTVNGFSLTGNPYRVSAPDNGPAPDALESVMRLGGVLNDAPRGSGKLIEAARLLFSDVATAETAWARWREVLKSDPDPETKGVLDAIDAELPKAPDGHPTLRGSIGLLTDALELADLGTFDHGVDQQRVVTR